MPGKPIGVALAVAVMLVVASKPSPARACLAPPAGPWPPTVTGACPAPGTPGLDAIRMTFTTNRGIPGKLQRLAAGLGASLAWDLADLPRHRARLPDPIGGFTSGAIFNACCGMSTSHGFGPEGAIGSLIARWNTLYPPYSLELMDDLERLNRRNHDPNEDPSCPGN